MSLSTASPVPAQASPDRVSGAPLLRLHRRDDARRAEVEDFIRGVYALRYGASVAAFAPVLVSLAEPGGAIVAAAGYRSADAGPLFLERYLPAPIEQVLAPHAAEMPARGDVVEIGHLAAGRGGAGRRLMFLLGRHLAGERFRWGTCTMTRELRRLMVRSGVTPLALAPADPSVLGAEAALWGSYYEHEPVVLAGELQPAVRGLAARWQPEEEMNE